MALNYEGSLLATTSKNGKKIKIYNTTTKELLQVLTRGAKKADILHLVFHRSSKFLACTSNKQAVHIYELFDSVKSINENECTGYLEKTSEDEIGYKNDTITLDPSVRNQTAKYWVSLNE